MTLGNAQSAAAARADTLDAEGRHDDAINELALGAQRGDVEAITRLYVALRYGTEANIAALNELRQRVSRFSA